MVISALAGMVGGTAHVDEHLHELLHLPRYLRAAVLVELREPVHCPPALGTLELPAAATAVRRVRSTLDPRKLLSRC